MTVLAEYSVFIVLSLHFMLNFRLHLMLIGHARLDRHTLHLVLGLIDHVVRVTLAGHVSLVGAQLYLVLDEFTLELQRSRVTIEVIVVTNLVTHGVHHNVDADNLVEFVYAKSSQALHRLEVDERGEGAPDGEANGTEQLNAELLEAVLARRDESVLVTKDSHVEKSKEAADAVNLDGLDWIIDTVAFENLRCSQVADAGLEANDQSRVDIYIVADTRDHDEARKATVHDSERQVLIGLLLAELVEGQVRDEGRHRR